MIMQQFDANFFPSMPSKLSKSNHSGQENGLKNPFEDHSWIWPDLIALVILKQEIVLNSCFLRKRAQRCAEWFCRSSAVSSRRPVFPQP